MRSPITPPGTDAGFLAGDISVPPDVFSRKGVGAVLALGIICAIAPLVGLSNKVSLYLENRSDYAVVFPGLVPHFFRAHPSYAPLDPAPRGSRRRRRTTSQPREMTQVVEPRTRLGRRYSTRRTVYVRAIRWRCCPAIIRASSSLSAARPRRPSRSRPSRGRSLTSRCRGAGTNTGSTPPARPITSSTASPSPPSPATRCGT